MLHSLEERQLPEVRTKSAEPPDEPRCLSSLIPLIYAPYRGFTSGQPLPSIQTAIDALHAAEIASDEFHVLDGACSALEGTEGLTQGMITGAQEAVDGLSKSGEFIAFDAADAALRFAQNNTSELNLIRHAVKLAEGAVNLELDLSQWALHHAGTIFKITKVESSGSVQSLIHASADTVPLRVLIQGTVLGEIFDVEVVWKPHFDLLALIKELFVELWEKIKRLAKV